MSMQWKGKKTSQDDEIDSMIYVNNLWREVNHYCFFLSAEVTVCDGMVGDGDELE